MTEEAIPKNMVEFALYMARECHRRSQNYYAEADQTSELDIKIRTAQQGTIYSDMQILFGMIYVTMSSINSMSDKLANKKGVEAVKTELTRKVEQYLGPLKKEIDEWKQREDKAKSTGAYGQHRSHNDSCDP